MINLRHKIIKQMYCIVSENNDAFFNLAAEEYLLKSFEEDIFMLWQSEPCVVVGKHQNTYAEINYQYTRNHQIKIARRLSGGGTVFHDRGNLNFTFIRNGEPGKLVDFKRFVMPVIGMLQQLNVNAEMGGKNDILVDGKKISGNAEHVYKNRVLHHGTLLFSSDLERLGDAIRVKEGRYFDKAVQSNRSRVMNISEKLKIPFDISMFQEKLYNYMLGNFNDTAIYKFNPEDRKQISQLVHEKYSTWEWIFGYSPDYYLQDKFKFREGFLSFRLDVSKGKITGFQLYGDVLSSTEKNLLSEKITGLHHREDELFDVLKESQGKISISEKEIFSFLSLLF